MGAFPVVIDLERAALDARGGFHPFRPGVEISVVYEDSTSGSSSAFLRYAPGAKVPPHRHLGYEHILVLEGAQEDEHGRYSAGTLVVNAPDTTHSVWSEEGCLVLIVWERSVRFLSDE